MGPMAGQVAGLVYHEPLGLDLIGLKIVFIDPVIPDKGIRHHENLALVGWVCQRFLIAGHIRIEHQLSKNRFLGTESLTLYYGAVLYYEQRLH